MKFVFTLVLIIFISHVFGIKLGDFVPGFLGSNAAHNNNESGSMKILLNHKKDASQSSALYCNRVQGINNSNVFCKNNSSNVIAKTYLASDMVASSPASSTVSGNNAVNKVEANRNSYALQSQQVRNTFSNQNQFTVPVEQNKDVNVKVGPQRVEFNFQY